PRRPGRRLRVQRDDARPAGLARHRRPAGRAPARDVMDPVALEIAHHRLASVAEEMGVVLGRTALSPNIKERRDYSCAVFDMGGMSPGSMPLATEIFQEGFRLPPVRLVSAGRVVADVLALFLANTRVPAEREGDLMAQWAALRVGADRLRALAAARGVRRLEVEMAALQAYSAALMRATLARLPPGTYRAADVLDDDGLGATRLPIAVAITIRRGRARIDFAGSAPQTRGPVNAN